jgi:maleylacetate reductase
LTGGFIWRDAGRTVVFRRQGVEEAPKLLREYGLDPFELVTTGRALATGEELGSAATAVHEVPEGSVPDLSAALLEHVGPRHLVAFGGGRLIDTAKAVASVTGRHVAAIPTTLSGAEMTGIHRLPTGAEERVRAMVRPRLVIADPEAMTSQAEQRLRASAMNSLAHGADSLYTPLANPVSRMTALRGAQLLATALDQPAPERDRDSLAEGSLLCGYAIDSGAFALHHVICQSLVRSCGTPHAETNAAILPRAMAFMVPRAPRELGELAAAIEADPGQIEARILQLAGNPLGLGALGADRSSVEQAIDSMLLRPELAFSPRPPTRADLEDLIDRAW